MRSKINPFGILTVVLLLLTTYLATVPMERPGMLGLWYSVEPSILFKPIIWKISPILIMISLLFISSMLYYLTSSRKAGYKNNFGLINWAFILCIVWGYIGTFLAGGGISIDQLGVSRWRSILYGMLVFFSLSFYLDEKVKMRWAMNVITFACLALNVYGLIRYFGFGGLITESLGKVVFWERSKLEVSCFVITYTLAMLMLGKSQHRLEKLLHWGALFAGYSVIFLSGRRTSMILALFSTGAVFFMALRQKQFVKFVKLGIPAFVVVSLIGITCFSAVKEKFIDRLATVRAVYDDSVEHGSTKGHLEDFRIGWKEVTSSSLHTVFGVGFVWEPKRPGILKTSDEISFVHNSLLTFWLSFGMVGVLTYFYVHIRTIWVCIRNKNFPQEVYLVVFLVWFVNEFLAGLFFPPFYIYFKSAALFFAVLALANSYINLEMPHKASDEGFVA